MGKIFRRIIGLLTIAVLLTGCGSERNQEIMTAKEFKKNMENMGFVVEDQTASAADSSYQKIYVALDEGKYSFEYYFMKGENSAEEVYQYAVSNLYQIYAEVAASSEGEDSSGKDFDMTAPDYYFRVIKKENTVLYVTAYREYENDVKRILNDIGYDVYVQ